MKNMLVSISGIDNAGKTTQIENLLAYFKEKNTKAVRIWSRGGYTPLYTWLKTMVRRFLRGKLPEPGKSPQREKLLQTGNISKIWLLLAISDLILYYGIYIRIQKYLFRRIILADRYLIDTYIDFRLNFSRIPFYNWYIWKLLLAVTPAPDKSIFLSIPLDIALKRAETKKEPFPDSNEIRILRFRYYKKIGKRWKTIDCTKDINSITEEIISYIYS